MFHEESFSQALFKTACVRKPGHQIKLLRIWRSLVTLPKCTISKLYTVDHDLLLSFIVVELSSYEARFFVQHNRCPGGNLLLAAEFEALINLL
jgi:hypothetical protein